LFENWSLEKRYIEFNGHAIVSNAMIKFEAGIKWINVISLTFAK